VLESDGTKEQPNEEDLVAASPDEASPEEDSAAEDGNGSVDDQETSVDDQETGETPEQDAEESLFFDLPDEEFVEETSEASVESAETDVEAGPLSEEDELLAAVDIQLSPEDQAEIERRGRMKWFVIHANTGHENKVKRNIEMAIKSNHMEESFGEVLVATQEVTEMKNGKRSTVKRKFFPSYILVEMIMNKETQHFINSIPGVTRFIGGTALKPQPITREEVDRILGRISAPDEIRQTLEIPYEVGDGVQVIDGPFTEWTGVVNEINPDKGKLKVMISIFGSETPVELDFLQVKPV
jgi:transcriptional antiterminator NusG